MLILVQNQWSRGGFQITFDDFRGPCIYHKCTTVWFVKSHPSFMRSFIMERAFYEYIASVNRRPLAKVMTILLTTENGLHNDIIYI